MNNQYVADIGDYGKYSLLRAFIDAGVKVGVNWYLTKNDGSADGSFTDYLEKDKLRRYSPEIFNALRSIATKDNKTVTDIQNSGILPGAEYYSELLEPQGSKANNEQQRKEWFEKSADVLSDAELIFMDPDNGLLESGGADKTNANKYVLPEEVEEYFSRGHNVVYYCHKGRRNFSKWESYKSMMFERIPEAQPTVLTYHKGTQRSYIFLIHEKDYKAYRKIIDRFLWKWNRIFSEEYTSKGNVAGKVTESAFVVEGTNGITVKIEKRADGRIQISSSDKPNTMTIMEADWFIERIRS